MPDEDEGREDQHHRRVDHRALHAALDLRRLLDLERDAVEHLSRIPAASPASTIETKRRSKTFGCRAIACERSRPPSTSARSSLTTAARYEVVGLLLEDHERATMLRPASIIVANWREKICSVFGLTFLKTFRAPSSPRGGELVQAARQQAADAELLAGRARSGAWSSPESSSPAALIAEYVKAATDVPREAIGRGVEGLKRDADSRCVHLRARDQSGFGMLELLMAMVMLNVGILAIVAAFSSGNSALARANRISTAGALANKQMEVYRGIKYDNIVFTTTEWNSALADSTYTNDTVYQQNMRTRPPRRRSSARSRTARRMSPRTPATRAIRRTGADHQSYRVDTYLYFDTPSYGNQLRTVTVVVRNPADLTRTYSRVTSTFDPSTGA